MEKIACPQCGAEVVFVSQVSVFAVCKYCHSALTRHGMDIRLLGEMAALQHDPTVLQLGLLTGVYKGSPFQVIGRLRQQWSDGAWNEWFLYLGNEQGAWLAEAQGRIAVTVPKPVPSGVTADTLRKNGEIEIDGETFQFQDRKEVTCVFSEGELPFSGAVGTAFLIM